MLLKSAFILLILFIFGNCDEEISRARILINKKILNKYLVEKKDIIIHYQIFNVGGSPAIDIHVNDESLPEDKFEIYSGLNNFQIPRLGAGQNITHTVIYRPKAGVWGKFNFTAGEISYLPEEEAKTKQYAFTSEPGEGYIITLKEFDRKFSPHVLDWIAFFVMSLPSLVIPFYLWYRSKNKYESIVKKHPKKH